MYRCANNNPIQTSFYSECVRQPHRFSHQKQPDQNATNAIRIKQNRGKINKADRYPVAHNGLVGGSSPSAPTTHSRVQRDFPASGETAPNWRRMPAAPRLCKRAVGFGRPFRRFCLWPRNSGFLARRSMSAETRLESRATAREVQAPHAAATTRLACRRDGRLPFREVADLRWLP
jgi:hypothetical protein